MPHYLHFPITFDTRIVTLRHNAEFVAKVKEVANAMKWNPNRSRRFKWNGTWMQMNYTLRGDFHVWPESKLMEG